MREVSASSCHERFGAYRTMTTVPPIARIASLIGDPARARMLSALMDGRSRTAGELAREATITPQTASSHLAKLVEGDLLTIEKQGRHRYHRLASSDVAHALEALFVVSAPVQPKQRLGPTDTGVRRARVCYDHMAGEIAVQLTEHWREQGWFSVSGDAWCLTSNGREGLHALGIDLPNAHLRRPALRGCIDWSERRCHLAGQLGAALLQAMLVQDLVRRQSGSRVLTITAHGERELARWLR
ncbi:helix-turn-helix transcriptional regulator [Stenotrophomonas sp. RG-453]|uniref:ArsR/SmtB family transcription factor n=1 Tax=Stenotrophomonas sp. RG-453 TaxID=2957502 RepID=UPI0029CA39C0|nr:helix-turn-helix transcriptional regulator [Stenotrophomonas sp. RG-453]MDX5516144.1 helix-turn-helix domain-containing protein [Stenotrophomonas sp. RG-453]